MAKTVFLGKMPDPFLLPDGSRVTPERWPEYRQILRDRIVDMEFGGMPPRPEVVRIEPLNPLSRTHVSHCLRIHAGTKEKQLTFTLQLWIPRVPGAYDAPIAKDEKFPVLLTGDQCYDNMGFDVVTLARERGYIAAAFNRLELASDCMGQQGGLYDIYPGMTFTDISAWAWGYSVCMDVFEQLDYVNEQEVGITGHSRGGKTVLLAAVTDERIRYVMPNNSGTHGANSYRCVVTEQGEGNRPSERLGDMLDAFPSWMGPQLTAYRDREQDLPYDMHYFGALIAPRYYLQCEGMQDYWINPRGACQNFRAVRACYRYLGCEDHCGAWFRPGGHRHALPEFSEFMDFMDRSRAGLPLAEHLRINPYPDMEDNFDW